MRWPWVSRLAFELVVGERDRLAVEVDRLRDALVAISRKQAGMPEVPKAQRPRSREEPMPPEVRALIDRFEGGAFREALEEQAKSLHRGGAPWSEVARVLAADE